MAEVLTRPDKPSSEREVVEEVVSDLITKSEDPPADSKLPEETSAASKVENDEDFDDDDVDVHIDSIENNVTSTTPANVQSPYSLSYHSQPVHPPQSIPSLQRPVGVDVDSPGMISGVSTLDYDLNQLRDEDKPWRKPGADITDYFNYGFNEETWMLYCIKQRRLRAENQQINAVVQKTAALNASGLMAQVFRGAKPAALINRRQGPTSIDVIGATDETSRRQAAAAAVLAAAAQRSSVPDMSTPPPGYASTNAGNAISALGQLANQRPPQMTQTSIGPVTGNFLQPAPAALQLQQQFAAALAAVRFPPRPGIVGPPNLFMPPGCRRPPGPPRSNTPTGQMWENPNAPRDEKERSSSVDRRLEWQANERSRGEGPFRHADDRRFESPRRYHDHRPYRRRGKSPSDRRYESPPRHRRHYNSRHRTRSPAPAGGSSIKRRDSSNDSDVESRRNRRRFRESRSPSTYHSSSKHRRKSRSSSRKSGSHRRGSSRRRTSRSRSRSKRREQANEPATKT